MANEDKKIERRWMETNPGIPPEMRSYFTELNKAVSSAGGWSTTTTTTTSSSSTTTSSSSSSSTTTTATA